MTDTIRLDFTGTDTGIARLVTELEEAGASHVTAEPEPRNGDHLGVQTYHGEISGLTPDKAIAAVSAYLATTTGHRVMINDIEVPPAT